MVVFVVLALVLISCGGSTSPQSTLPSHTDEPSELQTGDMPELPAVLKAMNEEERRRTAIFDINSGVVTEAERMLWNPLVRDARRERGFHQSMVEPLFILNYESGAIEPWLATGMTANHDLDVWTMQLRDGVTWSDGEAFDADDVVFTSQLILDTPELELDFAAGFIEAVESVEKVDDLTVQFNLTRPNPRFQLDYFSVKIWGSFAIVPEHIWNDKDPLTFTNYDPGQGWPVFTGPYTVGSFDEETFVYLRNDDWWGAKTGFKGLPAPEKLIWVVIDDEETRVAYAQQGWLDNVTNISLDSFTRLTEQNPTIIAWFDGLPYAWIDPCSRLLSVNHLVPPWGQKEMRWALNYAIDRDAIVSQVYENTTFAARHFFPSYPPLERYVELIENEGLYEEYPLTMHDPALAREVIEAQGWVEGADGYYEQNGEQLGLEIYAHSSSSSMRHTGTVIAEQLQLVGINATMTPLAENEWVAAKTRGEFEAMIDWDACGSISEPWAALDRYHARWSKPVGQEVSNYNNQIRWEHMEYSQLVDQLALLPLGDPQTDELFVDAMAIWLEELPFIPIVQEKQLVAFDITYWQGWPTAQNSYIHPPTWWQSTHVIIHNLEPTSP